MRRLLKALGLVVLTGFFALIGPIIATEILCHAQVDGPAYQPLLTNPERQRPAANSYMTYPEWHIVYAYEGLAETLKIGDEYQFNYLQSVMGFWSAECKLLQAADRHGGADFGTRATSYVIGPSFGLELFFKGLYENTLGLVFAKLRGQVKSPQDIAARDMAQTYAAFLHQTPWYEFDFAKSVTDLWAAPLENNLRGWERRLALGGEWRAKILYAKAIKSLVGATTGEANLTIYSVVKGLNREQLSSIKDVTVLEDLPQGIVIKSPRYAAFTTILVNIAKQGGEIVEIAGNNNILLSTLHPLNEVVNYQDKAKVLATLERQGFGQGRDLLEVKLANLASLLRQSEQGSFSLEHIYDY